MALRRVLALAAAAAFVLAACQPAAAPTVSPDQPAAPTGPSPQQPTATPGAPATPTPAAATATAAAADSPTPAPASPSPAAADCGPESPHLKNPGRLTIGTDNPAYPPYFLPGEGGNTEPWDPDQGDPTTGEGFESAVAYAVAGELGFSADQVDWIVVPFANSFAPGPKEFDIHLSQVSFKEERTEAADLSEGYYFGNQAVVVPEDGPFADATTISELRSARLGAQVGTTSYDAIENVIQPDTPASVYDSNDAAIQALEAGQIDGIVVDLPTAFFIIYVQTEGMKVLGQIGPEAGATPEHFSFVLEKDSPYTACVNQAVLALRADGTLDALADQWLEDRTVPELQP